MQTLNMSHNSVQRILRLYNSVQRILRLYKGYEDCWCLYFGIYEIVRHVFIIFILTNVQTFKCICLIPSDRTLDKNP